MLSEDKTKALDAAFASLAPRSQATRAEFDSVASLAEVHPVKVDGVIAGAVLVIGSEIHACILPHSFGRWLTRPVLRVLDGVIAKHGRATTRVTEGCTAGLGFVRRLGFTLTGAAGGTLTFQKVNHGL